MDKSPLFPDWSNDKWTDDSLAHAGRWAEAARLPCSNMPSGSYRVVYADPPWQYNGALNPNAQGDALDQYPTMPLDSICKMALPNIATDAVLFLWVTCPLLPEGLQVMTAWHFDYKSCIVWDKVNHMFGYYLGVRHELLLIGTRGSCLPDFRATEDSVIVIPKTHHSKKPPEFRDLIAAMYNGPRVELFARGKLPTGWDGFGNQYVPS